MCKMKDKKLIMNSDNRKATSLEPSNLEEALKFAELISKSSMVPVSFQGKPGDIVVAMQLGREINLGPIQSLQNITVINGRPCLWGDALLALAQRHPCFEYIQETFDDSTNTAQCKIKRKGYPEYITKFSFDDAKTAFLLNKKGPWQTYPKRMCQLRARGFALRDQFADALNGLISAEEAQDIYSTSVKVIQETEETNYGDYRSVPSVYLEPPKINNSKELLIKELYSLLEKSSNKKSTIQYLLENNSVDHIEEISEERLQLFIEKIKEKLSMKTSDL